MDVFVANEQDIPVDAARLSELARHTLNEEEVDPNTELSVLFVTSDHIRKLNARFAGDDYATDVLAFPMMEDDENVTLLGDVVICPRVAESNAHKLGHQLERELDTLVVHGTLHLLGYDHQSKQDGELMTRRQQEVMGSFEASSET
jgi:probable rRNA maturation factor